MRLIYSLLAFANLRLALAEYGRAELLDRYADEALVRARARVVVADSFGQRAGFRERLMPMR
ncbi:MULTISPECIES: hypothetical protein [unclassified Methylobacterium]|uniref:hypothetical protein n=1 Tax=unclassified Methylobacterium TaxID=2615210 RepID=UPI001FB8D39F|nr:MULTISPECIES: hypothetical protein [unclassified Methylobacterium]MCJ2020689.1 hypothetical protein [Methylobacterium sp. E-065]